MTRTGRRPGSATWARCLLTERWFHLLKRSSLIISFSCWVKAVKPEVHGSISVTKNESVLLYWCENERGGYVTLRNHFSKNVKLFLRHRCCCTSHVSSSNQIVECRLSAGASCQNQSVGEQTEAVVAGDAQSQVGLQVPEGRGHLALILSLPDTDESSA